MSKVVPLLVNDLDHFFNEILKLCLGDLAIPIRIKLFKNVVDVLFGGFFDVESISESSEDHAQFVSFDETGSVGVECSEGCR